MCLIAVAHRVHPAYPLVVAANRDELYARPTAPADWWSDAPELLAGRDLRSGGTWMGITRGGRFAAVTNVREGLAPAAGELSRGALVAGFLRSAAAPEAFLRQVEPHGERYAGFNLLVGDGCTLAYGSNRAPGVRVLEPGVYALSNHRLDTPWPKVVRARRAMEDAVAAAEGDGWDAGLWEMLADRVAAADDGLPDTGVGRERERLLSSPFIATEAYGTRASTVLTVAAEGEVRFVERSVHPGHAGWVERRHAFRIGG